MNGRARIGLLFLVAGAALLYLTPHHVTWGNHHYIKHAVTYGLLGIGAIFLLAGSRGS